MFGIYEHPYTAVKYTEIYSSAYTGIISICNTPECATLVCLREFNVQFSAQDSHTQTQQTHSLINKQFYLA